MRTWIVVAAGLVAGCTSREQRSIARAPERTARVEYRVEGEPTVAFITLLNADGGTEQREVPVPWTVAFNASQGAALTLSAQNRGPGAALSIVIAIDGRVVRTARSEGRGAVASVSEVCCP